MKKLMMIMIACCAIWGNVVQAQENQHNGSSLGIDFAPLLSQTTQSNLLYLHPVQKGAIRVTGNFLVELDNLDLSKNAPKEASIVMVTLGIGKEHHITSGKHHFIYGTDFCLGMGREEVSNVITSLYNMGINPLIGYSFAISPAFTIRFEANANLAFNYSETESKSDNITINNQYSHSSYSRSYNAKLLHNFKSMLIYRF